MKEIFTLIEKRKLKLEQTAFCQWLSSEHEPHEDPFAFTPSMVFFVSGFKDILLSLKSENPTSDIERQINTHCEEDLDHWKWYLHDLEALGFNFYSWGATVTDIFKLVWSDENAPTRELVYHSIHTIRQSTSEIRFVIVEVLEAAFGAFIKCMDAPIKRANVYDRLTYFGRTHVEKEESHSLGSWTGSGLPEFEDVSLEFSTKSQAEAIIIVDELFDLFETAFASWFHARNRYTRAEFSLTKPSTLESSFL